MSNSRVREILEGIGGGLAYLGFLVVLGFLVIMFFKGAGWLASVILPVSGWVTLIALALVPLCLIVSIPRVTRGWGGLGLVISSYSIGLCLWLWSFVIAYQFAGMAWLIVGLLMAGVGVVAVATIAALLHGEWFVLIQIIIGVVIVYVLRFVGYLIVEKSEPADDCVLPPPGPLTFDEDNVVASFFGFDFKGSRPSEPPDLRKLADEAARLRFRVKTETLPPGVRDAMERIASRLEAAVRGEPPPSDS